MTTTAPLNISDYLKYANLQMAAEAFIRDPISLEMTQDLATVLINGNKHASVFTATQASQFAAEWEAVDQRANTPTGFSGTLFKNKATGELVMSFRSTEFIDDSARDNQATNAMEIKAYGFAFGQIRDMEDWYKELRNDGRIPEGAAFSVTGYSLGGHLATAFNMMHGKETLADGSLRVQQVVTFNGAGIGGLAAPEQKNLTQLIDDFTRLSRNVSEHEFTFSDATLGDLYARAREAMKTGGLSEPDRQLLASIITPAPDATTVYDPQTRQQALMIQQAISRIETIRAEVLRLTGVSASDGGKPAKVDDTAIGQESLDYQMAVLTVQAHTSAAGLLDGLAQAYGDKAYVDKQFRFENQFDVVGATTPSAVANSQWHIGKDVQVFIEDQPTVRGGGVDSILLTSLRYADVKMLVDGYDKKDFGDTHSLVLLVDSLSVQNTLLQMLPVGERAATADALKQILVNASYLKRVNGAAVVGQDRGKAEGDVLENVLNALADLTLGPAQLRLKGSADGNTWWQTTPGADGSTGRNAFYALLQQIADSDVFKAAASGQIALKLEPSSGALLARARSDFGAFAALYSLSPFALTGGGTALADKVGATLASARDQWNADRAAASGNTAGSEPQITDQWLADRANMLDRKNWFGAQNIDPLNQAYRGKPGDSPYLADATYFKDEASGYQIAQGFDPAAPLRAVRRFYFGDARDNSYTGGESVDHLYGGDGSDTLSGGGDADYIEGNAGNDVLSGGEGRDILLGGTGDDRIDGGAEGDDLSGGTGDDVLEGGAGADTLSGGDDADRLLGGTGNDILRGGKGVDSYEFGTGFGDDVIEDSDGLASITVEGIGTLTGAGARQTGGNAWQTDDKRVTYTVLDLGAGRRDLRISFSDRPDTITVRNWGGGAAAATPSLHLFAAGTAVAEEAATTGTLGITLAPASVTDHGEVLGDLADYFDLDEEESVAARVEGQGGNDVLVGNEEAQALAGGVGNDLLFGGRGDDLLDGGDGNDLLNGGEGHDTITGGEGNDLILGDAYYAGLSGYSPDNWDDIEAIWGWGYRDTYTAGGFVSHATYLGGSDFFWADRVVSAGDRLIGFVTDGPSADAVDGDAAFGGAGDDLIAGSAGDDVFSGDDGDDVLVGYRGSDALYGGAGRDELVGGNDDDYLDGGDDGDRLVGGYGADALYGGSGNDLMIGDLLLLAGTDALPPAARLDLMGDDYLDGGAGNDELWGGAGNDSLIGGVGDDMLEGDGVATPDAYSGRDYLDGGDGNDTLLGQAGDDTLLGGSGDDYLAGADQHSTGAESELAGNDQLDGGAGDDTLVAGNGTDTLLGGTGDDVLVGGGQDDVLAGGDGDDFLYGDGFDETAEAGTDGADTLDGGAGNDVLYAQGGANVLLGGDGSDRLHGGSGDDYLAGGTGTDTVFGGGGNDTLLAEDGDYLAGGAGDDTYQVAFQNSLITTIDDAEGVNRLDGVDASELQVFSANGQTFVAYGSQGLVRLADAATLGALRVGDLAGAGTGDVSLQALLDERSSGRLRSGSWVAGGGLIDTARFSADQSLVGTAAADELRGGGGNDSLSGGAGNDLLLGADGNDVLFGMAGDDILNGGAGVDALDGGDGADLLISDGDDYLDGGQGDDTFRITLRPVSTVDGATTMAAAMVNDSQGNNTVVIDGLGVDAAQLSVFSQNGTTYLAIGGAGLLALGPSADLNALSVEDAAGQRHLLAGLPGVNAVTGRVQTGVWQAGVGVTATQDIATAQEITGSTFAEDVGGGVESDHVDAGAGDDFVMGNAGADNLAGGAGRDTLIGGAGNDTLYGGPSASASGDSSGSADAARDTFVFNTGDGNDQIIYDGAQVNPDARDVIEFGAGITLADLRVSDILAGSNDPRTQLVIQYGADDRIVLSPGGEGGIQSVRFADGSVVPLTTLLSQLPPRGIDATQVLGTAADDTLVGTAGSDLLQGYGGNDTLLGAGGRDVLVGGTGSNTYRFGANGGHALVTPTHGEIGLLQFASVDPATATVRIEGEDLVIGYGEGGYVRIPGYTARPELASQWHLQFDGQSSVTLGDFVQAAPAPQTLDLAERRAQFLDQQQWQLATTVQRDADDGIPVDVQQVQRAIQPGEVFQHDSYLQVVDVQETQTYVVRTPIYSSSTTLGSQAGSQPGRFVSARDGIAVGGQAIPIYGGYLTGPGDSSQDRELLGWVVPQGTSSARTRVTPHIIGWETSTYSYTVTTSSDIAQQVQITGTEGSDVVRPASATTRYPVLFRGTIDTGAGDDVIQLGSGSNSYWAGSWSRYQDWGRVPPEQLMLQSSDWYDRGLGAWIDAGTGDDRVSGTDGNDVILGGEGSDWLDGQAGADTYLVSARGQDVDHIADVAQFNSDDYFVSYGGDIDHPNRDRVEFDDSVALADLTYRWSPLTDEGEGYRTLELLHQGRLFLQIDYAVETVEGLLALRSHVDALARGRETSMPGVEQFVFADGTTLGIQAFLQAVPVAPVPTGDSLIEGTAGKDSLWGGSGNDTLVGAAGDDNLLGGGGNDRLVGGDGADLLYGEGGDDTYEGGSGADRLIDVSASSSDTYRYDLGDGVDTVLDSGGADTVLLGDGITPAATTVRLDEVGQLTLVFSDGGSLTLRRQYDSAGAAIAAGQIEQVVFADGTAWNLAQLRGQAATGSAGNDVLLGFDAADEMSAGVGNDTLLGRAGNDTLDGGAGDDVLYGGVGGDQLSGGTGRDTLAGDAGDDTFRYSLGDGADTVADTAGFDTVHLGAGITTAATSVQRDSTGALVLGFADGGSLTLLNQYYGATGASIEDQRIEQVVFEDGTVWNKDVLNTMTLPAPTAGADVIRGFDSDDAIHGLAGNDQLYGQGGNDRLFGDGGADILFGGLGQDTLDGGTEDDQIFGEAGADRLIGGAGRDVLYGGDGDDVYEGGTGNDDLSDEAFPTADTYIYNLGDGADTITDAGGVDLVRLGAGLTPAATTVRSNSSGSLVLGFPDGGSLTLNYQYNSVGEANTSRWIEQVAFDDGTVWDQARLRALAVTGGPAAETLNGFDTADAIVGAEGNDTLSGLAGDDTLDGGSGNDYLYGGDGVDRLLGGAGGDVLYGGAGNDAYEGGAGNDSLIDDSSTSSDTFTYALGDGADTVSDNGGTDTVRLTGGITPAATAVRRGNAGDLVLTFSDGGTLTLQTQYVGNTGAARPAFQVEQVVFDDGTVWDQAQLRALTVIGSAAAETIYGFDTADVMVGAAGSDTLYGAGGDDTLDGGSEGDVLSGDAGADRLIGGAGNDGLYGGEGNDIYEGGVGTDTMSDASTTSADVYRYNLGDGADTVSDSGGTDAVQLGSGITAAATTVRNRSGDLVMSFADGGTLTLSSQYDYTTSAAKPTRQIEQIVFADGTVWDQAQLRAQAVTGGAAADSLIGFDTDDSIVGGAGADNLYGVGGNDTLDGGADNDTLNGLAGDDTLLGGSGSDNLYGDDGNDTYEGGVGGDYLSDSSSTSADTYRYNLGDGADTLSDSGGTDTVQLGGGITPAGVTVRRNTSGQLVLTFSDGGTLTLNSQYNGTAGAATTATQVEQVVFADGTVWDQAQLRAVAVTGGSAADTLNGFDGADLISGGDGNDSLAGLAGDDTLLGGAGTDTLTGGDGNDVYEGGVGTDTLTDASTTSNETYRYNLGDGADTLSDSGGTDTVQLGSGITPAGVTVRRNTSGQLVLTFSDGGTLTLNGQYNGTTGAATPTTQVEQVVFEDGTVWDQAQLRAQAVTGGSAADTLNGFDGADVFSGGDGNDTLVGLAGDDTLLGGVGTDSLTGGEGNDTYEGGAGTDTLTDASTTSNETYRYNLGDGADTLSDSGGTDTVQLGSGITPAGVTVRRNTSGQLVLTFSDGGTLTLSGQYNGTTGAATPTTQVEQVVFADGTMWDQAQLRALAVTGGSAADTLNGFDGADVLSGGDGNDSLLGLAGDDTLLGGAGTDSLTGGDGNDVYEGGAGIDTLTDASTASNDTYRYNLGDGADTVADSGGTDTVRLGSSITAATTIVRRNSSGFLVLTFTDGGTLTLNSQYSSVGVAQAASQIEQVVFEDGTVWDQAQLRVQAGIGSASGETLYGFDTADTLSGAAGADALNGQAGDDVLDGGTENDTLNGEAGSDQLLGGAGNDTLNGGEGNDILVGGLGTDTLSDTSTTSNEAYRYNLGDGVDTLSDSGGADTVQLGGGITAATTVVRRLSAGQVVLTFADGGTLTLNSQYSSTGVAQVATQIEQVVFEDGTVWDQAQLRVQAGIGSLTADTLYGFDGADNLSGSGGNDTLYGQAGNDILDGGTGNDTMAGDVGDDTYIVDSAADVTTESASAGTDTVVASVSWILGTTLENLTLSGSGAITGTGNGQANVLLGNGAGNALNGLEGADYYDGGAGNDTLTDNSTTSGDAYRFGLGYGSDTIADSGGTDTLGFNSGVAADQIWFRQVGNNLEVSLIGTGDTATINNWYTGSAYHLEQFKTSDGKTLLDSQVQALVSAMAAFAPPAAGQTGLPADYQAALAPVIAANWA